MVIPVLRTGLAILSGICLLVGSAQGQDLTEEQILQRFEAQREMYRATVQGQKTRGLDMIAVPQGGEPAGAEAPAEGGTVVFGEFAPELQVNIAIRFAFDSASIAPDQHPLLEKMCGAMRQSDVALFRIVGHTDAKGSDSYNETLSKLRAEEVRRWLVQDCGIAAARLEALGMGKRFLANPADPAAAENRRVEFQALS
ncbi:OmpA family protein [Paracoccus versutus]|jgi:outer membrane protein OmpA-like peptidoglycan-associated protein|uniref:OmpA family protein n=1 Tax=Paracoccus versutus TaxID=34007 RepID=A0A3D9XGX3_PARVE|nr:OmpA family protein [Paracoccus versutus]WGR57882.1 OmpA family protein [Paracoccus versutus]WGR60410.1 OmpA family protein [Paracoccus ferrooxidans]